MSVEPTKCQARRTGLGSLETWAIVAVLVGAGAALGFPVGQWMIQDEAAAQVQAVKDGYAEASKAKEHLIQKCIGTADQASQTAEQAARTASQAAKKAEAAVESAKQ